MQTDLKSKQYVVPISQKQVRDCGHTSQAKTSGGGHINVLPAFICASIVCVHSILYATANLSLFISKHK